MKANSGNAVYRFAPAPPLAGRWPDWCAAAVHIGLRPLRTRFSVDGNILNVHRPWQRDFSVNLGDLYEIGVKVTHIGPFYEGISWVLNRGGDCVRVPEPAPAFGDLLNRFRLRANFDWQPFVDALGCAESRYFVCWQRPGTEPAGETAPGARPAPAQIDP